MFSIDEIFTDSIEIKGSKFISFLMPISLYEDELKRLREQHPKAVHYVSAFRSINEFDQIVEYSGDDGEPKGTSGKPTLAVLQGHNLINAAIITVRYFGGTKLGPGGLVRAYAQAANAAYDQAVLQPYEKLYRSSLQCEYSKISIVEYEVSRNHIQVLSKVFDEQGAVFDIEAAGADLENFYNLLDRSVIRM